MSQSLGAVVATAWEHELRTSPDPFWHAGEWLYDSLWGGPSRSYRERLDAREVNVYGEMIPRIERVRRHLRRLGNIRRDPGRLR